jgi:hypothetical protein
MNPEADVVPASIPMVAFSFRPRRTALRNPEHQWGDSSSIARLDARFNDY